MNNQNWLYVFDFDGTLVKQTNFIDSVQNIHDYFGFKIAVNPSAFDVDWTIVTSRPGRDKSLVEWVLKENNAIPTYKILTQPIWNTPIVNVEEEFKFKYDNMIKLATDTKKDVVIYVDNRKDVTDNVQRMFNKANTSIKFSAMNLASFVQMNYGRLMEVENHV